MPSTLPLYWMPQETKAARQSLIKMPSLFLVVVMIFYGVCLVATIGGYTHQPADPVEFVSP